MHRANCISALPCIPTLRVWNIYFSFPRPPFLLLYIAYTKCTWPHAPTKRSRAHLFDDNLREKMTTPFIHNNNNKVAYKSSSVLVNIPVRTFRNDEVHYRIQLVNDQQIQISALCLLYLHNATNLEMAGDRLSNKTQCIIGICFDKSSRARVKTHLRDAIICIYPKIQKFSKYVNKMNYTYSGNLLFTTTSSSK